MFSFASGKLRRSYDESLQAASEVQKSDSAQFKLDAIDFGRRLAAVRACPALQHVYCRSAHHWLAGTMLVTAVRASPHAMAVVQCFACSRARGVGRW